MTSFVRKNAGRGDRQACANPVEIGPILAPNFQKITEIACRTADSKWSFPAVDRIIIRLTILPACTIGQMHGHLS